MSSSIETSEAEPAGEVAPPASQPSAPIRGLRAMAVVRWLLLIGVAVLAGATWWHFVLRTEPVAEGPDRYYCPMHPQIRSPVPGTCPICYMNLEPIPDERTASASGVDEGPVEPDEPSGPGLATVMLTTERRQTSGIRTVAVRRASIGGTVRWPATIEAREGARGEVRVRTEAFVERVAVRETGARVRAGQVLAWVYSPEILRASEEMLAAHRWRAGATEGERAAELSLGAAEEQAHERLRLLGVPDDEIERMVSSGRGDRRIPLRAPISGYVTRFEAVVGTYAMPETVLYEITDLSRVRVVASAFGDDVEAASRSARARFVPRDGGAEIDLALELVEPALASETRTARVRFLAANRGTELLPGQIGEVVIERPAHDALLVPRDAVIDVGSSRHVFVERERGVFEPRVVEVGALHGDDREIVAGLVAGEVVVARGAFVLDSESRLQAALAPEAPSTAEAGTTVPAEDEHTHAEAPR